MRQQAGVCPCQVFPCTLIQAAVWPRTGDLGRSIKAKPEKASVTIYSDLPYSAAHNEGTATAGRGHHTRIPKRQFMGDHPKVQQAAKEIIEKEINKIINQ